MFHAMPRDEDVRNAKDWPIPRYAMCFGFRLDTPLAFLRPQYRSLVWSFYHKHIDNCDLIEFGEAYRRKPCAFPTAAWELLDGIEDTGETKISLIDALWSIPRDSISILYTHLLRDASQYSNLEQKMLTKQQWIQNRLRVLHRLDVFGSLCGALTAALMEQCLEKQHLLASSQHPLTQDFGTMYAEETIVRIGSIWGTSFYFISGRERNWYRQEIKHMLKRLQS
jgi:hypothetical protein